MPAVVIADDACPGNAEAAQDLAQVLAADMRAHVDHSGTLVADLDPATGIVVEGMGAAFRSDKRPQLLVIVGVPGLGNALRVGAIERECQQLAADQPEYAFLHVTSPPHFFSAHITSS